MASAAQSSVERVAQAAATLQLTIEIRTMDASTRTAADAAAACGCTVEQIVKSLVFDGGDDLVLLLVSGGHEADLPAVSHRIGRELARCDAKRVRQRTGFAIGGVAPIGHLEPLPTYFDAALLDHPIVWGVAGRPDSVFAVEPSALVAATGAHVVTMTG